MIGALNTQSHKCLEGVMNGAPGTLVVAVIADIFHNYDIDGLDCNTAPLLITCLPQQFHIISTS